MSRARSVTVVLAAAAPVCLLLALAVGSVPLGPATLWQVLTGHGPAIANAIVLDLRLPRALTAFAVGGLLAVSGALLQVLLRNPLADPYVLGVSGGAAVAALLSMLFGLSTAWITGNAFLGSLAAMVLVFGLARLDRPGAPARLLLTGVVVAAGCGALISLILVLSPQAELPGMLFWLMGDLSQTRRPGIGLLVLALGTAGGYALARPLNLLARGELAAAALGENPRRLRAAVYALASLMTATAVTLAGAIGFLGLVIPHALRLLGHTDHRLLLPASAVLGGSVLVLADMLARTVVAPVQLPVGVITALTGVPVFLYLLNRDRRP